MSILVGNTSKVYHQKKTEQIQLDRPALSAFSSIAEGIEPPRHANTFLNNVTYFTGYHIFSEEGQKWIKTQVGESIEFDKLFALELQWFKPLRFFAVSATHPSPLPSLPPRPILERHILVYSSSFQRLVFPVVSKSTFGRTLDLAYSPIPSPGSASAKSCIYSFLALVSLFGFDDASHDCMDCRSCALAAHSFIASVMEEMTVDGLQSLIMLVCIGLIHGYSSTTDHSPGSTPILLG